MGRRSRGNLGLYRQRVAKRPADIPFRGPGTPSAGGGATYQDWNEAPLTLENAAFWTRLNGLRGAGFSHEVDGDGNLVVTYPSGGASAQQKQGTRKGMVLLSTAELDPWPNGVPTGETAGVFRPETTIFKAEVEFADGYGPSGNGNLVAIGLTHFADDQDGSLSMPGDWTTQHAFLRLNANIDPSTDDGDNRYRVGIGGNGGTTEANIPRMRNQGGSHTDNDAANALGYNTILWAGQQSRVSVTYGAYNNTTLADPYKAHVGNFHSYHQYNDSNCASRYPHLYLAFGHWSGASPGGTVKISKIRWVMQNVAGRLAYPGA